MKSTLYAMVTYNKRGDRKEKLTNLTWEQCMKKYEEEKKKPFPRPTIWNDNGNGDRVEGY